VIETTCATCVGPVGARAPAGVALTGGVDVAVAVVVATGVNLGVEAAVGVA
jgi:hypothetical protein